MVFSETRCGHCGSPFRYPVDYGVVRYCSAECRVASVPPVNPWEYKGCRARHYYSRRRKKAVNAGDRIDPLVVYVAFGWTCVLCRGTIDPTLTIPDPQCATIDHIVPLGQGGQHTWDNVQPAHKKCNEDKDNR